MSVSSICLKGAKLSLSMFIFYELFIKEAYGNYAVLLYGTVIVATALVMVDLISKGGKLPFSGFPVMLLGYGLYSFLVGNFISRDMSWFYSIMVTYFAFAIVCFDCCYVINRCKSSEWLLNVFLVSAIACSVQTIFFGADYRTEVIVRTMSTENNPNTLGTTMIIGIFALISRKKYVVNKFWISMTLVVAFLYVILLSASRKSLFAAIGLIAVWIFSVLKVDKHFSLRKISILFAIIVAIGIGIFYFLTEYAGTSSFARMLLLSSGASTRATLYRDAIDYWKMSPIIGIGFCQYQIWSPYKLYSHSSYAEILCCTGVVGVIIFFVPLFYWFKKILKAAIYGDKENRYEFVMCFAMVIVELALGVGQIYIYDIAHLLVLAYLSVSVDCIAIEQQRDKRIKALFGDSCLHRRFFNKHLHSLP